MDIRLLYVDGCPNWQQMEDRLREALAVAGLNIVPEHVAVTTPEEAERLGFRGSPTVLVDGADPFADDAAQVGLSCRIYRTPEGVAGAPTVAQLLEVFR